MSSTVKYFINKNIYILLCLRYPLADNSKYLWYCCIRAKILMSFNIIWRLQLFKHKLIFFNYYLATLRPTLGHYRGGSLIHLVLITCVLHIRPEGHLGPRNEVGSLSPAEHLVGFEPTTFRLWLQRLNPLGHSANNNNHQFKVIVADTAILPLLSYTKNSFSLKKKETVFLKSILRYKWSWKTAAKLHHTPPQKLSMTYVLSIEVNTDFRR